MFNNNDVFDGELVTTDASFFAPAPYTIIDGLLARYAIKRRQIEQVAALFEGDIGGVVSHFINGNQGKRGGYSSLSAEQIFQAEGAIAALNSVFWSEALALTDVYECMPQARRDEWNEQIREMTSPEFDGDTVQATLTTLLESRATFFAERVDGIFRALSREHVTNVPEGFGKRMIVANVITYYDTIDHSTAGYISDLRCIVARFMGRDEPKWTSTRVLIDALRRDTGVWHSLDGGSLRIRLYKKGTAHLEVHPDIAQRLNGMLAHLYPRAIASSTRTQKTKPNKNFALLRKPLPFAVLELIGESRIVDGGTYVAFPYTGSDALRVAASDALQAIGGVVEKHGVRFAYPAGEVITGILLSGCLPDQKSHQFYPTSGALAADVIELADIQDDSRCCEPSAGQGGLADLMPKDRTTCVEVDPLFCDVLQAKGHEAVNADFLEWSTTAPQFDRVVMNPPYSEGRAALHFKAALRLVAPGGRIVAVLPGSMRGTELAPGWDAEWSEVYADAFAGTGVRVAIYTAARPK